MKTNYFDEGYILEVEEDGFARIRFSQGVGVLGGYFESPPVKIISEGKEYHWDGRSSIPAGEVVSHNFLGGQGVGADVYVCRFATGTTIEARRK